MRLWLNSSIAPSLLSWPWGQARVCEVCLLPAGPTNYSFLWSDLFHGQMALLHVCTFRLRQYELQAVFLYFCIWYGTALNSFNKWLEKKLSLWERRVNLNPDFPYSSQTRLSLGQKLKLDSLTCFAQGLVQVCPLLHFSYVILIEWFLSRIKNK